MLHGQRTDSIRACRTRASIWHAAMLVAGAGIILTLIGQSLIFVLLPATASWTHFVISGSFATAMVAFFGVYRFHMDREDHLTGLAPSPERLKGQPHTHGYAQRATAITSRIGATPN